MLSVLCPQCKSAYRVDESRIPPQGGVITCKQCQTRIPLRPPAAPPVELVEELTEADEVAEESAPAAPASASERPSTAIAAPPTPPEAALPSLDISLPELGQAAAAARATAAASAQPAPARPGSASSAQQNALAAHEVAPGSSLYECPHCHKPFYLTEAKTTGGSAPPLQSKGVDKAAVADGRKTVLVVDDQEFFRTFTRDLLGRKYRVLEARTVSDAVAHLHECQLLVLDLTLDNEDGREILRRKPAGVKCLIFSGQEDSMIDPSVFRELQAMGADDMLFKSIAAGDALKEKAGRLLGEITDEKPSLD